MHESYIFYFLDKGVSIHFSRVELLKHIVKVPCGSISILYLHYTTPINTLEDLVVDCVKDVVLVIVL